MLKARKRWISLLVVLAFLLTLLPAGMASASSTYSINYVQQINAGYSGQVGTLTITMDPVSASTSTNKFVILSLPSSPSGYMLFPSGMPTINGTNYFNTTNGASFTLGRLSNTEVKLTVSGVASSVYVDPNSDSRIQIPLEIKVPNGVSGDIALTASAPSDSVFSSGSVVIARAGSGAVTLAGENVATITTSGGNSGVIDIKENTSGALEGKLTLTLPPGFSWDGLEIGYPKVVWGDVALDTSKGGGDGIATDNDGRELDLWFTSSNTASFVKIVGKIKVDESVAATGDVKITVGGDPNYSPDELVIAKYGDYGITAKAFSTKDLIAGQVAQDIGKLELDESAPGSILAGRTLTLTLPDGVKWSAFPKKDPDNSKNSADLDIDQATIVGSDGKMLKLTFKNPTTTDAATLVLKGMQVTPAPDFSGDIAVELGGSLGVTGTVVLGTVKTPVTVTTSSVPDVKVGKAGQAIGDIVITEAAAGAIKGGTPKCAKIDDKKLVVSDDSITSGTSQLQLQLPAGVTFTSTPTVSVTDGDLQIDQGSVKTDTTAANEGLLYFNIKSSSTKASTIKISDVKITVDRTVPEGNIVLKVKGTAVNQTLNNELKDTIFQGRTSATKIAIANVVTPAPGEQTGTAVFKIGETKYTVNGQEYTMDVAPVAEAGRTYLPARFVANAMGVPDSNIIWDQANQTVTVIRNDRIVQMKVGSNQILVNGIALTMDVAPKVVPGRVLIPFRFLAQALGAEVVWDAADPNTITLNF